jgi:ATP-dependent DNA ligase I
VKLADLVRVSNDVASTSARSTKVALLAGFLKELGPQEIVPAVGMLSGSPRQGKIGVGWSTAYGVEVDHAAESSLDVLDLDRAIDEVERTTGAGSVGERRKILETMLTRATSDEADFVRRLFTGELRQGALEGVMTDAIAKASDIGIDVVRRAQMLSGDLCRVAHLALTDGEAALKEIGFELFRPVMPMLASTAADVSQALESFELASVEWKLDGIRMQIHRRGDEVRIYTRNLNDITDALPGVVDAIRALPVRSVVLDGEAIGLTEDERPQAFQDTVAKDGRGRAVGFLFDVLHLDGTDLLDEPLHDRIAHLEKFAPGLRIPGVMTDQADRAQMILNDALGAGHEGVVVKDASSVYAAGRRGKAWRKVKPVRTYDLVVLGAEWGHGRRQGWLSNLHLGARDPSTGDFVMVGKCFKGLTDELLDFQTKELLAREVSREGIFVRVRPELVVEIALDGVQRSTRYPGGLALRFARVKRYRPDKNPDEADTIGSLQELLGR